MDGRMPSTNRTYPNQPLYGGDLTEAIADGLARLPRIPPVQERIVKIGPVEIRGHVVLAPMAGVCDHPFRWLCKQAGASAVYSEFISSDGLIRGNEGSHRMLRYTADERPIGVQIFGSDPAVIHDAVQLVEETGVDIVDLNFGCPVKKVIKREAGSALLKNPSLLGQIVRAAVRAARRIPVTAKIRAGWDAFNAQEICRIVEANGAQAIAVHGRTQKMGYSGSANWDVIRQVREIVSIPVIGNGDVFSPKDAARMLHETGCDLVMVGRGAQGAPWLFAQANAYFRGLPVPQMAWPDRIAVAVAHLTLMLGEKPQHVAVRLFRGHLSHYTKTLPWSAAFRKEVFTMDDPDEVMSRLRGYALQLAKADPYAADAPAATAQAAECAT